MSSSSRFKKICISSLTSVMLLGALTACAEKPAPAKAAPIKTADGIVKLTWFQGEGAVK